METKSLLYGLIGFFAGGLLVSVAATTFEKPTHEAMDMSMSQMTETLKNKEGDEFDQAYIAGMTEHHQGAVEMAQLAGENAKHEEIKALSRDIIAAQEKEIDTMKQWQVEWGYSTDTKDVHPEHH